MRIHNRYLLPWAHRLANGVMASLALATAAAFGAGHLGCASLLGRVCLALLYASPAGLLASIADPARFSLVEGVAGENGYDELV